MIWPFSKRRDKRAAPAEAYWMLVDNGPEDTAEVKAVIAAADAIGDGVAGLPRFGEMFLQRFPQFADWGFPPNGYFPSSEVHEAIFDTLDAFVVAARDAVRGTEKDA